MKTQQKIFMNRELSWLKFNERVLEEAENREVPLCERLTFASIYQSNLDEFFMVRVGSLIDQMLLDKNMKENKTKMTPQEQIDAIIPQVQKLNRRKDSVYEEMMDSLKEHNIHLVNFQKISKKESEYLRAYFQAEIAPLISPTIIGKRQPFPFLKNKEIYAVAVLETKNGKEKLGIIPCGNETFDRLINISGKDAYMLSEEMILHYVPRIFKGYHVKAKTLIRITRNADIDADSMYDEDLDYRDFMVELIKKRKKLAPVRMELSREMDGEIIDLLCEYLELERKYVFYTQTPLDLSFVFKIQDILRKETELFFEKRVPQRSPQFNEEMPIMDQIEKEDKLLSYPYESMRPFLKLLQEAAENQSTVTCFLFDLNRLKYINDHYGHNEGDFAIQVIGHALSSVTRSTDICARFSSDEFYLLTMDYTKEDADELLTRVYKYLDNYNKISHKEYNISASGGYAQSTPGASLSKEDVKALFSKADEHMYQQKQIFHQDLDK